MIYLDHHSTTPVDARVAKAMWPYFMDNFGNPAAVHALGEEAKIAVEDAREKVAGLLGASPDQIYFTNSASEANNIVLKSLDSFTITTNSEHSSIRRCLDNRIGNVIEINILEDGNLNYQELEENLKYHEDIPKLVTIIAANNEIGTIHDLYYIGELCEKYNAKFHTDATQAIGKFPIDVNKMKLFALTMSGHKIYGPKGVGVLYVRDSSLLVPITDGGYQNTFVSGTQNVPAIVGMGEACEIINYEENIKIEQLRNYMLRKLLEEIPDIVVNGTMVNRLQNNLNISIPGIPAEVLIKGLDDVIISGGSACESGNIEPSHIIQAINSPYPDCAIRISLGRSTTQQDVEQAAMRIAEAVASMRSE